MEDPIFMCMMARSMVDKKEEEGTRKSLKDRQLSMIGAVNRLLEVVCLGKGGGGQATIWYDWGLQQNAGVKHMY